MKNILLVIVTGAITLTACNSSTNKESIKSTSADTTTAVSEKENSETSGSIASTDSNKAVSIQPIIEAYLQLKNALTTDNAKEAATAGIILQTSFISVNKTSLNTTQKKVLEDVEDDAKEHSEHIGKNAGNIKHQREHFDMLSKDIADLIKTFGTAGQTLYKDFCPMYNDNKGAIWISETKEIKNPYLGKKMPTCGTVKEEMK